MGEEVYSGNVAINHTPRFMKLVANPRPAMLVWSSQDDCEEFPFQPRLVFEVSRAEIEVADVTQVVIRDLVRKDPQRTGSGEPPLPPVQRVLTFPDGSDSAKEHVHESVKLYNAFRKLGVASLVPDLTVGDENRELKLNENGSSAVKREGSVELTPSALAFTRGKGLSRVVTSLHIEERQPLGDKFDLCELIGEGGFANVYRAVHRESNKEVAVKIMLLKTGESLDASFSTLSSKTSETTAPLGGKGERIRTDETILTQESATSAEDDVEEESPPLVREMSEHSRRIRNFEWEITALRKIRDELPLHPNLIRFYGVCTASNPMRMCLVMEKLDGGELFDRIVTRQRYTERDAAFLFRTLIRTLHELHHKIGLIHRDLKPENIIFADTSFYSTVKIADFGTAKIIGMEDPFEDSRIGSQGYSAPEVQRRLYTPACDIWSMGVLLFCLLVGYLPFPPGFMAIVKIMTGKFEFVEEDWKDISKDAQDLIKKMLTVSISKRITTDQILSHPWLINIDKDTEEAPDLNETKDRIKTLNAKRKFKAAAMATVLSARLRLNRVLKENALEGIKNTFRGRSRTRTASSVNANNT